MEPGHSGSCPTRRQLLGGSASLALSALLAACSIRQPTVVVSSTLAPSPSASSTVQLPTTAPVLPTVSRQPRIDIAPRSALVDAPVTLQIAGLPPSQEVLLTAAASFTGGTYRSSAVFPSDAQGVVNVATQAPLSGTYSDPSAMGLFWSMALTPSTTSSSSSSSRVFEVSPPLVMTFTATVAGTTIASTAIERRFVDPAVMRIPVRDHGLIGTLFLPTGPGPHPGLLSWGGSSGGYSEAQAALLASHGYAALALAYFGVPPLPENLVNIPLEYFETAIGWLQAQEGVNGDRLAVVGTSRGGELALLVGATFPQIKAVVGYVPSGLLWPGEDNTGVARARPAWTYRGASLPYLTTSFFHPELADPAERERATIPVERITGPVLLISGEDDALWPSTKLAQIAMDRLGQYQHAYPDRHLQYAGAGHLISEPYLPTTASTSYYNPAVKATLDVGGSAKGYAVAAADSWPQVLMFLQDSLRA
ncbi:MAG: acyl-CoA thioesterase/bile acid-CoA:amino acid N-acyltransferase family protein [Thermomicrobiales bacterium]